VRELRQMIFKSRRDKIGIYMIEREQHQQIHWPIQATGHTEKKPHITPKNQICRQDFTLACMVHFRLQILMQKASLNVHITNNPAPYI
jgi:hypothetical protein